jgi:hypothetical protein
MIRKGPNAKAQRAATGAEGGCWRSAAAPGWPSSWNLDFEVRASSRAIYRSNDCVSDSLDPRPARRGQYNDGELSRREILLKLEVRVGRHKDGEAFLLSGVEQLPISELRPAPLMGGHYLMLSQQPP